MNDTNPALPEPALDAQIMNIRPRNTHSGVAHSAYAEGHRDARHAAAELAAAAQARIAELEKALSRRDTDWVLAMGAALGTDSGHYVPIVPEVEPFRKLFAALASTSGAEPVAAHALTATSVAAHESANLSDNATPPVVQPARQLHSISSIEIERLIAECVPGGSICDPQQVADAIRSYCNAWEPVVQPEAVPHSAAASQPVAPDLMKLARRTLWIAYCWNDHNFDKPAHHYAQTTAAECGIKSFEEANAWLATPPAAPEPPAAEMQTLREDEIRASERERICAAIKAADDKASEGDYMLDSDDCIAVVRGTWNSGAHNA